jgi:sugar transferase (PEP-CTERM system associated)
MKFRIAILIGGDILLTLAALYSALLVRFGQHAAVYRYFVKSYQIPIILLGTVLVVSYLTESYLPGKNVKKRELLVNVVIVGTGSFFCLSALYYLAPESMVGRGLLVLTILFFALYQYAWHCMFFFGHNHQRFAQRVLVLGTGELAAKIQEIAQESRGYYQIGGFVRCGTLAIGEKEVLSEQILGEADALRDIALREHADLIVIALSERRGVFPLRDALSCKLNGAEVLDAPSFYELVCGKLMLEQITPSWFIFSSGFRRPTFINFLKRIIDVFLAFGGLVLSIPIFIVSSLLIIYDSPGPLFFTQVRVGNKEKQFRLIKFRTMRQDAESETGAVWAVENDPRVTKFGRFMRKTRIDEIPQLINVLKGDMSFVGPRPERPEFVEKLKAIIPYYSRRHFIKPGVTGWAQVRYPYGSSIEDAVEKLRYDLYYIKNLSPFLDTLIFFETIKVVLFGRGAR